MLRRISMMGSLVFVRGKPTRSVIGLALATFFTAIYTLSSPYARKPLANLSFTAMWCAQLVFCLDGTVVTPARAMTRSDAGKLSGSMPAA